MMFIGYMKNLFITYFFVSVTFGYQVFRHRDELSSVVRSVVKAFVDTPLFNLTTPFEIQLLL